MYFAKYEQVVHKVFGLHSHPLSATVRSQLSCPGLGDAPLYLRHVANNVLDQRVTGVSQRIFPVAVFGCILCIASCTSPMPAGFWQGYEPALLALEVGDQGGHAGYRAILWKSDHPGTFHPSSVITFASENDWPFLDSTRYSSTDVRSWTYDGTAVFPLDFDGFNTAINGADTYRCFPRWFDTDAVVCRFKTPWLTVEDEDWKDAYGYAMISSNGQYMALYHLWGDRANLTLPR
ncbi:MAG: hypothetical protein KF797_07395 [Flavobacteriales bacterium]|nr:hypothetical protein [Flavobacteriales bacterium]